jgi:predicted ABC-type ATPase
VPRKRARKAPVFHLVAGPNGAGKTTFAKQYLPQYAGTFQFINADLIAAGLSPFRPESAALSAGKLLLQEFQRLAAARTTFAAESTLAGKGLARRLVGLRKSGYRLHLHYLWLDSAELALRRVEERVRGGGHAVPEETVRRRYVAGLKQLRRTYLDVFDVVLLFDNSGPEPRLVARRSEGKWATFDLRLMRSVVGGSA